MLFSLGTMAQTTSQPDTLVMENQDVLTTEKKPLPQKTYQRNIVKMNLSSLLLKNYNFSYERLISRKTSVLASFRTMPQTNLGSLKLSEKITTITEDGQLQEDLSLITASNNAYTAEIRFYGGRKPGAKGFYFGLYGRKADFNLDYAYTYETATNSYNIPLQTKASGLGGGFLMGAQFAIAKRVMVDMYILGAHYGKLKGNVAATTNLSGLSEDERTQLQQELNDLLVIGNTSFLNTTVSSNGVVGKIEGPFAGVRGLGVSIGFSF
jgi:hypothetical protein